MGLEDDIQLKRAELTRLQAALARIPADDALRATVQKATEAETKARLAFLVAGNAQTQGEHLATQAVVDEALEQQAIAAQNRVLLLEEACRVEGKLEALEKLQRQADFEAGLAKAVAPGTEAKKVSACREVLEARLLAHFAAGGGPPGDFWEVRRILFDSGLSWDDMLKGASGKLSSLRMGVAP